MIICSFRSFDEPWSAPHRRVWMALGASEGPVGDEARGETRETADTSRVDTDPDGHDAAAEMQERAETLISGIKRSSNTDYAALDGTQRDLLVSALTGLFNEETGQYRTHVDALLKEHGELIEELGIPLERDLMAIVGSADTSPAPAPAAPAAAAATREIQIPNYLLSVRPGDTMSAIIRNKLANESMDPLRIQIAKQYQLGDGFPTYAKGDTDGAQFMRLLMAKRNSDYYQNLIHPGNQVRFGNDGSITISKGGAKYAPGEKERAAAAPASPAPAAKEAAPAAPERPSEKIAALEKNWTEIIEPGIRRSVIPLSGTTVSVENSGPNNLEKTVTLTNASGKIVKLIIKPPTNLTEETYGIDASKQRFLVVDTEGNQTDYTGVFGSGNQLDFALNLLRTPDKSTVEAPAAPAAAPAEGPPVAEPPASDRVEAAAPDEPAPAEARQARQARQAERAEARQERRDQRYEELPLAKKLPIIERKGKVLLETIKSNLLQGQDAGFELQKLYSLLKPLKGQHDEYNTMMSKWGFEFSTQDGAFILEVDKNNPNRRLIIESRMWSDGLYNIKAIRR